MAHLKDLVLVKYLNLIESAHTNINLFSDVRRLIKILIFKQSSLISHHNKLDHFKNKNKVKRFSNLKLPIGDKDPKLACTL